MKQARTKLAKLMQRKAAFHNRMRRFIKRLKRGEVHKVSGEQHEGCTHNWERDGQTLLSVRRPSRPGRPLGVCATNGSNRQINGRLAASRQ
jgi:hypothetical protein